MFLIYMAHQLGHAVNNIPTIQVGSKIKFPGSAHLRGKIVGGLIN